jgi:hypothetical protein
MNRRSYPFVLLGAWHAIPAHSHHLSDEKPATLVGELLAALAHPAMHPELIALLTIPIAVIFGLWIVARRHRR